MTQSFMAPEQLAARLSQAALGVFDIASIHVGDQLGLYEFLAGRDSFTAGELAAVAATNQRYTREWLEQQGATGILICANPEADPEERRYSLPAEYHDLFVNPECLSAIPPLAQIVMGTLEPIAKLLAAFRNGGGIPFEAFGENLAEGQALGNRPMFRHHLAQEWIGAMPDIVARFEADPPARVADIGMGYGWSSVYLAQGFPKIAVDGFDLDEASVRRARSLAVNQGVADRVTFDCRDAGDEDLRGRYDLAIAIQCIHDMPDPVSVLASMRRLVGLGGTVLIVDERAPERYSAPGSDLDRSLYGFSLFHCLPTGMADQPSVATGAVIRPAMMREYARQAGFSSVEMLPIEHDSFWFYRMTP